MERHINLVLDRIINLLINRNEIFLETDGSNKNIYIYGNIIKQINFILLNSFPNFEVPDIYKTNKRDLLRIIKENSLIEKGIDYTKIHNINSIINMIEDNDTYLFVSDDYSSYISEYFGDRNKTIVNDYIFKALHKNIPIIYDLTK